MQKTRPTGTPGRDATRLGVVVAFYIVTVMAAVRLAPAPSSARTVGPAAGADSSSPPGEPYRWPFDPPIEITSSFGEFRRGHFHGGIDLSTSHTTGREVHVAQDGWVWRVRASGSGYGRSLYCRLADGSTAVYAHLQSFAPDIAAYVEAAQESLSRYEVDLWPPRGRLPFRRGDVVAKSGESGAGPPHLHFEMRSGAEADIGMSPLRQAFTARDTIPPMILWVGLEPYGAGSAVDGEASRRIYAPVAGTMPRKTGRPADTSSKAGSPAARGSSSETSDPPGAAAGTLRLRSRPVITGAALPVLRTLDPGVSGNRLGLYAARFLVDGALRYAVTFDRFDWNRAHEAELAYNWEAARRGDSFVLNLYRPIGATDLVFGSFRPLAGILSAEGDEALSPGAHEAEIVVSDPAGNEARLLFSFTVEPSSRSQPIGLPALRGRGSPVPLSPRLIASYEWSARNVSIDVASGAVGHPADSAVAILETPLGDCAGFFSGWRAGRATASLPLPEGLYAPAVLRIVRKGVPVRVDTLDLAVVTRGPAVTLVRRGLTIAAPPHAFFGPGAIRFSPVRVSSRPGFEAVGQGVGLDTGDLVLDKPVTVRLTVPPGASTTRLGLYRQGEGGSWDWIGNETGPGGMGGETRYLGTFALFTDTAPPALGTFRPGPGQSVAGPRPSLLVGIEDSGSGFGWREIEATIDSLAQIVVYDPESGTLSGRSRRDLAAGPHTWTVTVHDRAGNVATRTATFRVR